MRLSGKLFIIFVFGAVNIHSINAAPNKKIKRHYKSSYTKKAKPHCIKSILKVAINEKSLVGINLLDACSKITVTYGAPTGIESADAPKEEGATSETTSTQISPSSPTSGTPESTKKANEVKFVRWSYIRGHSKYSFLIDVKTGRVVQIEAIGLADPVVSTKRGVTLGSLFSDVVNQYSSPEKYEFDDKHVLVSYVNKYNVLFRLSKTEDQKPYKVVGIVVTAGKV